MKERVGTVRPELTGPALRRASPDLTGPGSRPKGGGPFLEMSRNRPPVRCRVRPPAGRRLAAPACRLRASAEPARNAPRRLRLLPKVRVHSSVAVPEQSAGRLRGRGDRAGGGRDQDVESVSAHGVARGREALAEVGFGLGDREQSRHREGRRRALRDHANGMSGRRRYGTNRAASAHPVRAFHLLCPAAATMAANAPASRLAPPTSAPSMSGCANRLAAVAAVTLPP